MTNKYPEQPRRKMDKIQAMGQEFEAADLRAKSDALLLACGWIRHGPCDLAWARPDRRIVNYSAAPHPYENMDDAVRLAEAMGLIVSNIMLRDDGYLAAVQKFDIKGEDGIFIAVGPAIAEAISEAILAAVRDKEPA